MIVAYILVVVGGFFCGFAFVGSLLDIHTALSPRLAFWIGVPVAVVGFVVHEWLKRTTKREK